ncbi:hypothetical protein J4E85_004461 [Alternaria conjuncta]|uniref:uncharacterized protein n=1 Tax=Alternaria conjuncta TaxID=181017 RepID=UPI00221E50D0|nr:uncharacterized protein J4E85_004461 [Alternaria conjuncta]KAI4929840.1 hypothetical protein J4E85_004461 [Alternaria conjuncta]
MAEPMSNLSPEKLNTYSDNIIVDDIDMAYNDPPSSPFVEHIGVQDQENIAPGAAATPVKPLIDFEDSVPQSAFRVSPEKKFGLKERTSPMKTLPAKNLMDDFEDPALKTGSADRQTPQKNISPIKEIATERRGSAMSSHSYKSQSPSKSSRVPSPETVQRKPTHTHQRQTSVTPSKRPASSHQESPLRDNEGLTTAMKFMEDSNFKTRETPRKRTSRGHEFEIDLSMDNTDFNPDGPEPTSLDIDDTCFSNFSEMPGIDMTKFASLKQSPTKSSMPDIESFSSSRRASPGRGRNSPSKSITEPNLRSYYRDQRSPAKGGSQVPATPSQRSQMLNLLDFELPPPPTPRSLPTVTIRELESVKSQFQSQVSSLTASLSGKEAEIDALSKAIADAERRVGEAQETVRDERSAREYAETQMVDWKSKGEEVQKLLQDVQAEMARNDAEREDLLARLADAEKRADDAESRSSELETKVIEAESKNVDMTTFINNDDGDENKKVYSELECQSAIAEKVNEIARDLHTAYKAKHEKKIKALKDNYQKKADEKCKELRAQIASLEGQVEDAEKKRDNTFSRINPGQHDSRDQSQGASPSKTTRNAEDAQMLEAQRAEIENLKARLAGLQSELQSLRKSHDTLVEDLEAERIEKGELVAAAEQMLSMCGEKMEEMQQEDLRRSQMASAPPAAPQQQAPPQQAMRNTGFLAGGPGASRPGSALGGGRPGSAMGDRLGAMNERTGSGIAKPSGLRAPGGLKFQGAPGLNRSQSGGKSRLLSNIERMGGGKAQE